MAKFDPDIGWSKTKGTLNLTAATQSGLKILTAVVQKADRVVSPIEERR
jgi:hypothetical protein